MIQQEKEKYKIGEHGFWQSWFSKLFFTLISVKVWGLTACTIVSTMLILKHDINGTQWVTFNSTVWALIFGMKEIFRISEKRDKVEKDLAEKNINVRQAIASMGSQTGVQKGSTYTTEGLEIVGDEPEA